MCSIEINFVKELISEKEHSNVNELIRKDKLIRRNWQR